MNAFTKYMDNIPETPFDKTKLAKLVESAKGPGRTAQQFAAILGVAVSTVTRIINMENKGPSKVSLLEAIAESADPHSGVTLEMLLEANGSTKISYHFAAEFERIGCRIITEALQNIGEINTEEDVYIDSDVYPNSLLEVYTGRNSRMRFDMVAKTKRYGKWAFEFKATRGTAGNGIYHSWLLKMINILKTSDIGKITLVLSYKPLFEQIKKVLDNIENSKILSVILLDSNEGTIVEEYCSGRQYGLWTEFNDDKIFLTDILKERYKAQYGIPDNDETTQKSVANYCADRRKDLVDLFKRLGLNGELDIFIENEGKHKGYVFYKSEVPFINELLDERGARLIAVRKGLHAKLDDEYAVHIYESIFNMYIRRCDGSEFEAFQKTFRVYNLLDIPLHKQSIIMRQIQKNYECMANKVFEEKLRNITSRQDDLAWIKYVSEEMRKLYKKSMRLYDLMYEIRQDEINDKALDVYENMTDDELERMEEEESLSITIYQNYIQNEHVRELLKKQSEITGETLPWDVSISNFTPGKSKDELTLAEIRSLEEIDKKLKILYEAAREEVIKDTIGSSDTGYPFEKDYLRKTDEFMTSEDLVKKAESFYVEEIAEETRQRGV